MINRGQLVTNTSVRELTAERIVRIRSPQLELLKQRLQGPGVDIRHSAADGIEFTGLTMERVGAIAATESIELHELSTRTSTLEDVFLDLTDNGEHP